ncbi:MAG: hypothetical protein FWD05_09155 [Oscillospiraceae bacterium]|nr:hypothetical protein [Oscillospiraceae bacterium]
MVEYEIDSHVRSAIDYKGVSAPIIAFLSLLSSLIALIYFFDNLREVLILLFLGFALVYTCILTIAGFISLRSYSNWLKNNNARIENVLANISDSEDRRMVISYIYYAMTSKLLTEYPDVYKEIEPPNLWYNFLGLRIRAYCGLIVCVGLIMSIVTIVQQQL